MVRYLTYRKCNTPTSIMRFVWAGLRIKINSTVCLLMTKSPRSGVYSASSRKRAFKCGWVAARGRINPTIPHPRGSNGTRKAATQLQTLSASTTSIHQLVSMIVSLVDFMDLSHGQTRSCVVLYLKPKIIMKHRLLDVA